MRAFVILVSLCLLAPGMARSADPRSGGMVVGSFPQRRADRYTTRDGLPSGKALDVVVEGKAVHVYFQTGGATFENGKWSAYKVNRANPFPFVKYDRLPAGSQVRSAAQGKDGRVWVVTGDGLFHSEGDRYVPASPPKQYLTNQAQINIDAQMTCVAVDPNGTVWLGSDVGVFATDGKNYWHPFDRNGGMPFEEVTCLAFGADASLWAGTTEGVCRYTGASGWQYYWGPRYLPHNRVNAIAVDSQGAAWVGTDSGVARIYDASTTLAKKAEHYQAITDARHNRRGFVTGSRLKVPGDVTQGVVYEASDNDGLWTALYVGAQAFRYAVTKDPKARAEARKSMFAMLDLVRYTGIPGFPARAILDRSKEKIGVDVEGYSAEETVRISGETDKIWFQSPIDPNVLCKGDTSSDELDGHYYAWYLFHELVANDAEKKQVRQAVEAVTDNLLRHELTLVGHTGRKTRWGVYHPKYINDDPLWWEERGLNALSILSYLKIAEHIVGHARYREMYRELIEKHHYLLNTLQQKVGEPWWDVNHSDDEMAFMMYYTLLRLERDPAHRRILLQSVDRSWRIERPEASPFFNFVFGAVTGRPCDVEASVATLQEWPWELVEWQMRATHRHDVEVRVRRGEGRASSQLNRVLPPSERRVMRWNGNPYQADGGSPNGASEEDGAAWLLPYWMGRYHGFIVER